VGGEGVGRGGPGMKASRPSGSTATNPVDRGEGLTRGSLYVCPERALVLSHRHPGDVPGMHVMTVDRGAARVVLTIGRTLMPAAVPRVASPTATANGSPPPDNA
jgi:hypothetical protein